jgi:hypothetical protein
MKPVCSVLMVCTLLGSVLLVALARPIPTHATPHAPAHAVPPVPAALPPDIIRQFDLAGSYGGSIAAVALGDTLVATGQGGALTLLRREPDNTLSALGRLPLSDLVQDIALNGTLAYVALGESGIAIADISAPAAPRLLGSLPLVGAALSVQVVGSTAYVATAGLGGGLHVLDVSDPAAPRPLGNLPLSGGSASGVRVVGSVAYVTVGFGGLRIVDVSIPAAPVLLGELDTPGRARALAAAGTFVYIADDSAGLRSIDVSDPAAPTEAGSASLSGEARAITLNGQTAAVATSAGLWLVDLSNPARPQVLAPALTTLPIFDAALAAGLTYAAAGNEGLLLLDSTDPQNIALLDRFATLADTRDIWLAAPLAYVAAGTGGLHIVDVSDPAAPSGRGQIDTIEPALALQVRDNLAYVATGRGDIEVFDISTPQTPTLHTTIPVAAGSVVGLHIAGSSAWVALGNSGIQQLEISAAQVVSPTASITPTLITSRDTLGSALGLTVADDTVYVANRSGVFSSSPAQPWAEYAIGEDAYVRDIAIAGSRAYAADSGFPSGLHLFDVTSTAAPFAPLGFAPVAAPGSALAVQPADAGDLAYVAAGSGGVLLFDTSDPARPTRRSGYDTPGLARELQVAGDRVYVADGDGGLLILQISDIPARFVFLPLVER